MDFPFGAHQALRQRRLRGQERPGNLRRAQSPQGTQRQRHLRLPVQRGMAAGEDEPQAVVGKVHSAFGRLLALAGGLRLVAERIAFLAAGAVTAHGIDELATRGGHDPGAGVVRHSGLRPGSERGREGLLRRLLGQVEGAGEADQPGYNPSPLAPKEVFGGGGDVTHSPARLRGRDGCAGSGRISMQPCSPQHAVGIRAAQSMASSRSRQSSM